MLKGHANDGPPPSRQPDAALINGEGGAVAARLQDQVVKARRESRSAGETHFYNEKEKEIYEP